MGYGDWLEHMLRKPPYEKPNPSFWHRHQHRHDRLVSSRRCLGLPAQLLNPVPNAVNRSLTLAETEMLRNLNKEFRANELPAELYSQLVRNGAVMRMKNTCAPGPKGVKIRTPQWAVEAAAEIGAEIAERIDGTGVRVIGDMRLLSAVQLSATQHSATRSDQERAAHRPRGRGAGALRGSRGGGRRARAAHRGRQVAHRSPGVVEGTRAGTRPSLPQAATASLSLCRYSQQLP
ncbi:hypothetical protein [Streptomyces caeruleatus]|uniref:hypothetical protein n=1 Tax=Streptomyces caeruleatus TaxID=661399 RepID=UPI000A6B585B|nr:hypothetical protein [Streptomyces caeruleatus]